MHQPPGNLEYLIDHYVSRFGVRTQPGRERVVAALLPVLRTVSDPVRRERMGQAARQRALDKFCSSKIIPLYEHLYERVLSRS